MTNQNEKIWTNVLQGPKLGLLRHHELLKSPEKSFLLLSWQVSIGKVRSLSIRKCALYEEKQNILKMWCAWHYRICADMRQLMHYCGGCWGILCMALLCCSSPFRVRHRILQPSTSHANGRGSPRCKPCTVRRWAFIAAWSPNAVLQTGQGAISDPCVTLLCRKSPALVAKSRLHPGKAHVNLLFSFLIALDPGPWCTFMCFRRSVGRMNVAPHLYKHWNLPSTVTKWLTYAL